jgi:hypothetical protein
MSPRPIPKGKKEPKEDKKDMKKDEEDELEQDQPTFQLPPPRLTPLTRPISTFQPEQTQAPPPQSVASAEELAGPRLTRITRETRVQEPQEPKKLEVKVDPLEASLPSLPDQPRSKSLDTTKTSDGSSTGQTAGIVIGVLLLVLAIVGVLFWTYRRRNRTMWVTSPSINNIKTQSIMTDDREAPSAPIIRALEHPIYIAPENSYTHGTLPESPMDRTLSAVRLEPIMHTSLITPLARFSNLIRNSLFPSPYRASVAQSSIYPNDSASQIGGHTEEPHIGTMYADNHETSVPMKKIGALANSESKKRLYY